MLVCLGLFWEIRACHRNTCEKEFSMKALRLLGAVTVLALASSAHAQAPTSRILGPGDKAPDFTLLSNDWKEVKLSDFRGKKNVVVVFYVLAFTDT
jgi:peroxiredoxin